MGSASWEIADRGLDAWNRPLPEVLVTHRAGAAARPAVPASGLLPARTTPSPPQYPLHPTWFRHAPITGNASPCRTPGTPAAPGMVGCWCGSWAAINTGHNLHCVLGPLHCAPTGCHQGGGG